MHSPNPLRIALFGSTGSIGVNTLDVVRQNPGRFEITALAAHRNIDVLAEQIAEFHPKAVAVGDETAAVELKSRHPGCEVLAGAEGLRELAARGEYDIFVGALVGFAGLAPTVEAIKLGKRIALANKETLVVAGELLSAMATQSGSEIIPIDSEHSAIYQCLVGESRESIRRIILTASGGPFRTLPKELFSTITREMALKHPKWVMGQKITIDSATLMNKGLEIIEAKWLFGVPLSKIDVVIHPQSIVHSFVEFSDGSIKAQLGMPDMRMPIQYALAAPERLDTSYSLLDLASSSPLEFSEPDFEKFPCLRLAHLAGERGGLYPCVLNAANEIAVEAFLDGRIPFTRIPTLIESAMESGEISGTNKELEASMALEQIISCDEERRRWTIRQLEIGY
jgi:1-deoxy-D-xylulose-5-phosphate reductoisomerase